MTTLRNHYETQVLWPDAAPDDKEYTGPLTCQVCGEYLPGKEPHLTRDGRSPHNGADYTGYIVQSHHSDEAGGAVCTDCAEQEDSQDADDEAPLIRQLVLWQRKGGGRHVWLDDGRLTLDGPECGHVQFMGTDAGYLSAAVKAIGGTVLRDTEDECPKTERNVER